VDGKPVVNECYVYEIIVLGFLEERWMSCFNQMGISYQVIDDEKPISILTGPIQDQAELRGVMNKIWDLNLELISLTRKNRYTGKGGVSDA
jgi:hypothetical protein